MKLRFYFLATVMLSSMLVMAQPPQGGFGGPGGQFNPEEMVKRQTDEMVKDLGLDAKQTEKVAAINKKYSEKMSQMFQQGQGDREGMREKMQAMRTEKDAELKTVLTAEQYAKYQELEKQRMERFRQQRPAGAGGPPERRGQQRGSGDD